jgi:hypothetical protein
MVDASGLESGNVELIGEDEDLEHVHGLRPALLSVERRIVQGAVAGRARAVKMVPE